MITHGEITFSSTAESLLLVPLSTSPVYIALAPIIRIRNISIILLTVIYAKSIFSSNLHGF